LRLNEQITALKVRLIDENGEQKGVVFKREALTRAQELGLDLVEISPKADPPVCKIVDYGKFVYQKTKRQKDQKKTQVRVKLKEIKLKPNIDVHDMNFKIKHAKEFLQKGNKVKFSCMFRGREIMFANRGREVFDGIERELMLVAHPESPVRMMGKTMMALYIPGPNKHLIEQEKRKDEENKSEDA
jgi:translation initiation factor IF-3